MHHNSHTSHHERTTKMRSRNAETPANQPKPLRERFDL
jgi:hypothetical protein